MRSFVVLLLLLVFSSPLFADWDYKYLTLDELMSKSSLIIVAEIKEIEEKIDGERVTQKILFSPVTLLKGQAEPTGIAYHAAYVPKLCKQPESHYIDSPPGTKYLLFLEKQNDSYISVLGPCGALRVSEYINKQVMWYTDDSVAQKYADQWREKPLREVITRIKEKIEQTSAATADKAASPPQLKPMIPSEQIVVQSEQLQVDYRAWLAEKPRKLVIRLLDEKNLPKTIAKLGFKSAAIEEGLVILICSDDRSNLGEAIAVTTDGKDRSKLLKDFGWDVSDSSDSRIKLLKRIKVQKSAAPNP